MTTSSTPSTAPPLNCTSRTRQASPWHEEPWEDWVCSYTTVLRDGDIYRMYYRGRIAGSWTGYAESNDGIHWTKPRLGLVEFDGSTANNIILNSAVTFFPFLDTRPGVPADERFKANGVIRSGPEAGLVGYVSADGMSWRQLQDEPILSSTVENAFDSQNVMFWSEAEQSYVLYARHWKGGRRATMRATSSDFRAWTSPTFMTYSDTGTTTPSAHLYTNQTQPYFRAPHIYISLPGRIFFADAEHLVHPDDIVAAGRRTVSPELRRFYGQTLDQQLQDCPGDYSDAVLLSTRAGSTRYDFTFLQSFVRPGIGLANWTTRNNYPACGFVQTSPTELSFYVKRHYGQRTRYLERMALRLDGFASCPLRKRADANQAADVLRAGTRNQLLDERGRKHSRRAAAPRWNAARRPLPGRLCGNDGRSHRPGRALARGQRSIRRERPTDQAEVRHAGRGSVFASI